MRVVIDGVIEFEQTSLKVGSWRRDSIDRFAAGLDGVVSVDMGSRGREIKQFGLVSADSEQALSGKVGLLQGLVDGAEHVLVIGDGREFGNVRVDSVDVAGRKIGGRGWSGEAEIRYTQLREV